MLYRLIFVAVAAEIRSLNLTRTESKFDEAFADSTEGGSRSGRTDNRILLLTLPPRPLVMATRNTLPLAMSDVTGILKNWLVALGTATSLLYHWNILGSAPTISTPRTAGCDSVTCRTVGWLVMRTGPNGISSEWPTISAPKVMSLLVALP